MKGVTFDDLQKIGHLVDRYVTEMRGDLFTLERLKKHPSRTVHIYIKLIEQPNGLAEVIVTDNGSGIRPEDQDFVFERFFHSGNQ